MSEPLESTRDVELEALLLIFRANIELLINRLRQCSGELEGTDPPEGAVIPALAAARALDGVIDDIVEILVCQARSEGQSWAAIGHALQVTRQAAFQRFGSRSGDAPLVADEIVADAPGRAIRAVRRFLAGELDDLREEFDQRMTKGCSVGLLDSVRSRLTEELGSVADLGAASISSRFGYLVADIAIFYERGERKARIALDHDGRIAGFFVLDSNIPREIRLEGEQM